MLDEVRQDDDLSSRQLQQKTDEELYELYRLSKNREALGILLDRYDDRLEMFLYGIVRHKQDAEDLMLDTFAEAASLRTVFRGDSSFRVWLFAIAKRLAYRYLRKKRRFGVFNSYIVPDNGDQPEVCMLKEERNRLLYDAMDELKPEYRNVLYLRYFEEMRPEEIQRVTGKKAKQVYNLLNRGRESLRKKLEETGYTAEEKNDKPGEAILPEKAETDISRGR